ncbi:MAG: 4-hydroxy-tetrahydrodipicolinate synthase [Solirubrobacteraceae bacterium]|nr:MAG: 4-hydroxy-tetrahydrodipicolinate synthase [Solirubrobacterales bacterium]
MPALGRLLTAMVTPLDAAGAIDDNATVRLVHHLLDHGSDGLVVAGSTGEAATLSDDEHIGLIDLVVEELGCHAATVIAGAGSNDTRHACQLTERAVAAGADAVLSVTPYYNKPNRRGLRRHYEEVARAAGGTPILLYNIPSRTALDVPNDLLGELAQIDGITGVKQANPDNLGLIDGLDLYAGNDDMFCDVLELGGAGGILVASHLVGDAMARMVSEPLKRRAIDQELQDVYSALAVTTNPIPVKAALNMIGLDVGGLRLPLVEADAGEAGVIRAALEQHGLLAATPSAS